MARDSVVKQFLATQVVADEHGIDQTGTSDGSCLVNSSTCVPVDVNNTGVTVTTPRLTGLWCLAGHYQGDNDLQLERLNVYFNEASGGELQTLNCHVLLS